MEIWNKKKNIWAIFFEQNNHSFIADHPESAGITLDEYVECTKHWDTVIKPKTLEMLTDDLIKKYIKIYIHERLEKSIKLQESLVEKNDEMRAKGIAFTKRRKLVQIANGLVGVEEYYRKLSHGNYKVVSIQNNLTPTLVSDLKSMGIRKFISFYFETLCKV